VGYCYNQGRKGTTKTGDYNRPNGTKVSWTLRLVDHGKDVKCLQLPEHDTST
jgi:hypothetical protein